MATSDYVPMIVVFGRPGAGKSTIVAGAAQRLQNDNNVLTLDLDDCVPNWMKINFGQGIYPTLAQRREFADRCVSYVRQQVASNNNTIVVVVSFSFVNTDLRQSFRHHFDGAQWVLVDVDETIAQARIQQRANHFYKGQPTTGLDSNSNANNLHKHNDDNPDWQFAPVTFAHTVLNGLDPVSDNVQTLLDMIFSLNKHNRTKST